LELYPDAVFLDLGSNLGVYSLLVAQTRHSAGDLRPGRVVAVDAAGDNLAYISHSLTNNNISKDMVTLVHNAISDVSETLYPVPNLADDPLTNPGSWQFVGKNDIGRREILGPPTSSITMKTLLHAIPSTTLIVKMDIQGLECRALQSLGEFPASHPMPYIFMEWKELVISARRCPNLVGFIDLMKAQGYSPRWPTKLAMMPEHCLKGPSVDVLWVHKSARPIWDEAKDWVLECAFHSQLRFIGNTSTPQRMLHALPSYLSCEGCDVLFDSKLKLGFELDADDSRIHLATILTSGGPGAPIASRYMYQLDFMLSTLLNNSPDTPINFIIITDSLKPKKMISNTIGKFLSEKVILEKFGSIQTDDVATFMKSKEFLSEKMKVLPDLKVEFLDFNSILGKHNASIQEMKKYYGPNNKTVWLPPGDLRRGAYFPDSPENHALEIVFPPRYDRDLFYIAPFYHLDLSRIKKLIVVDLDLEFRCSLGDLYSQFDDFSEEELFAVGNNQSPYYFLATQSYREKHPGSKVGEAGKMQGFNTGVVLFNLEKMRESSIYMAESSLEKMVELYNSFLPASDWGLGDQEWITLFGWKYPNMVKLLPCEYNRQISANTKGGRWAKYFRCDQETKIFHTTPLW